MSDSKIQHRPFEVVNTAIQAWDDLSAFTTICLAGVEYGKAAPTFAEVAKRLVNFAQKTSSEQLTQALELMNPERYSERATELQKFVELHCQSGFPYLYGIASLRLWSILEAYVKDMLHEMLIGFPELQSKEELLQLKGSLLEFLQLSESDRATELLRLLESKLAAPNQIGVGRFEKLLATVGLGGGVDDLVRDTLFELWAVRNVVAHKNGLADQRFLKLCPSFGASIGMPLQISPLHFRRYSSASFWYLVEVHRRLRCEYPQHVPEDWGNVREFDEILRNLERNLRVLSEAKEPGGPP